jgi:cell division septation protein DedD
LSELTHHDTDDGFHEIQLSGKQLVFLFMATTIVAVLIFLCGVQVGRNVKIERAAVVDGADSVGAASPPPAAATPSQAVAAGGPPAAEPPAPAQEPDDELSYAKRLQADTAPAEKLKPPSQASPTPAAKAAPPTAPPSSGSQPSPAASAGQARAAAPPKQGVENDSRPGAWIVQVISLQDRGAATGIAKRLTGKGYPAFVLDPAPGAPAIYRVQVGGYPDRRDAEQASRRLEKDEQFKPLVRSR